MPGRSTSATSRAACSPSSSARKRAAPVEPGIVVADELTPGAVADLDPATAWGIATARGGTLDHAAIVAGALGIPLIVGLGPALLSVAEGATLALDGDAGAVTIEPDAAATAALEQRREADAAARAEALAAADEPVVLADGRRIEVFANIGNAGDAQLAVSQGAEGVGLLRTEFLFHDRTTPPSEDEQVAALTEIAERAGRPPADRPHARRRGRQAAAVPGHRAGGQPVPRPARHPAVAGAAGAVLDAAARDPARRRRAPAVGDVPDGLNRGRAAGRARAARRRARALGSTAQLEVGVMIEVPAAALEAGAARTARGLLLDRHQRSVPVHDGGRARQSGAGGVAGTKRWNRC